MAGKLLLAATGVLAQGHLAPPAIDQGFELLVENAFDEYDWTCETVSGLPAWIKGSVIMPTAARFEYEGLKFKSILDSFGKLEQIQLSNGKVCSRSKMLGSKFYNDSLKEKTVAPTMLFEETVPPRHCLNPSHHALPGPADAACRALENLAGGNDNVFVKVYDVGGRLFAVTDSPKALEIDPETLGVIGGVKWQDTFKPLAQHTPMVAAAHLEPDPVSDNLIGVQQEVNTFDFKGTVDVFEMAPDNRLQRTLIKRYVTPKVRYFHSLGATPSWVILPHQPYTFDGITTVMTGKSMKEAFKLEDANVKMEFHVISRKDPNAEPLIFTVDRFFFQHIANAFENETGVTIDLGHTTTFALSGPLADIKATATKTTRDSSYTKMKIMRYHLHTSGAMKGQWSQEILSDVAASTEFMRINENFKGLPYKYYYANEWYHGGQKEMGAMAIVKQDVVTGERKYWKGGPGQFPSEPVFVPRPTEKGSAAVEDDGVLLFTVLDGLSKSSYIYVVDAKTMNRVSMAKLPARLSYTTHPTWFDGLIKKDQVGESSIIV